MDSVTQAALGAAVAEAGLGRRLGNRAVLWGIALGTLPDLDIVFYPWLDQIQRLEWHRGLSHSLLAMTVASPLLAWVISKLHGGKVGVMRAAVTVWLILFTHVLIDVFTVYGTMVFEPFSDLRVGFNNLFIIDPLFTVPLLIGVVAALFCARESRARFRWNAAGLIVSSLYVLWSFGAKAVATERIAEAMERENIVPVRFQTSPTPFNTLLWRGLAETEAGFYIGYHSLLRSQEPVRFLFIPKPRGAVPARRVFDRLVWFSEGFFTVEETSGGWIVRDWRFGDLRQPDGSIESVFSWSVPEPDDAEALQPRRARFTAEAVKDLRERLLGP